MAFLVDVLVATLLFAPVEYSWQRYLEHKENIVIALDVHEWRSLIVIVLYFGFCTYFTNGKTLGKWMTRVRVVSLTHERVSLWQAMERALGYARRRSRLALGFCSSSSIATGSACMTGLRRRLWWMSERERNHM
jgi:uncharacterized RDD family membrane protein YckC